MTKQQYRGQLKDRRWIVRRCERIIVAGGGCERCGDTERIQVHHKHYVSGRAAWDYSDAELEVLCRECHKAEHGIGTERKPKGCKAIKAPQRCVHEACLLSSLAVNSQYRQAMANHAMQIYWLVGALATSQGRELLSRLIAGRRPAEQSAMELLRTNVVRWNDRGLIQ